MYRKEPISIFHGSNNAFTKFETKYIGSAVGTAGAGMGFYFTSEILETSGYGKFIYEIDYKSLNLKKNLSNFHKTLNHDAVIKIIDNCLINSKGDCNYYENYDDYSYDDYIKKRNIVLRKEILFNIKNSFLNYTDTEIIADLVNAGISIDVLFDVLRKEGYTHTLDQYDDSRFPNAQHYILYFEPKIKKRYQINNFSDLEKIRNQVLRLNK